LSDALKHEHVERVALALARLADGKGFSIIKARAEGPLRQLGYRKALRAPGEDAVVEGLRIALDAVIEILRTRDFRVSSRRADYPGALIAEAALGLGRFGTPARSHLQRRDEAAAEIGAAGSTFASYEPEVLRELAVLLVDFSSQPEALNALLAPTIQERYQETTAAKHRDWAVVWQEHHCTFDSRGVMLEMDRIIEIGSAVDALQSALLWVEYFNHTTPGVISTSRVRHATISREEDIGGAHVTEVLFDPPIPRDSTREFAMRLTLNTDRLCRPRLRTLNAVNSIRPPRITLQFDLDYCPSLMWWFTHLDERGQEFAPVKGQEIEVEPTGYVEHTFKPVNAGYVYGLAWQWPDGKL
jgi:hypothetical protein